jgi:hypothetical protein
MPSWLACTVTSTPAWGASSICWSACCRGAVGHRLSLGGMTEGLDQVENVGTILPLPAPPGLAHGMATVIALEPDIGTPGFRQAVTVGTVNRPLSPVKRSSASDWDVWCRSFAIAPTTFSLKTTDRYFPVFRCLMVSVSPTPKYRACPTLIDKSSFARNAVLMPSALAPASRPGCAVPQRRERVHRGFLRGEGGRLCSAGAKYPDKSYITF